MLASPEHFSFPTRVLVCLSRYRSSLLLAPFSLKRTTTVDFDHAIASLTGAPSICRNFSKRYSSKRFQKARHFILPVPLESKDSSVEKSSKERIPSRESRAHISSHRKRSSLFSGQFRTITRVAQRRPPIYLAYAPPGCLLFFGAAA